ncbi:MAG: hypothetical protein EOO29_44790 [Comamonadaceae bacterium]|nr:MAG: hypothetical protein EOO29_44790 [Comamonadaceae bacterium]
MMSEGQQHNLAANASLGAGDSLWQACIDQLAQELPEQQFVSATSDALKRAVRGELQALFARAEK